MMKSPFKALIFVWIFGADLGDPNCSSLLAIPAENVRSCNLRCGHSSRKWLVNSLLQGKHLGTLVEQTSRKWVFLRILKDAFLVSVRRQLQYNIELYPLFKGCYKTLLCTTQKCLHIGKKSETLILQNILQGLQGPLLPNLLVT